MSDPTQIAIFVALAAGAIVCGIIVLYLVRRLRKERRAVPAEPEDDFDAQSSTSSINDLSLGMFTPSPISPMSAWSDQDMDIASTHSPRNLGNAGAPKSPHDSSRKKGGWTDTGADSPGPSWSPMAPMSESAILNSTMFHDSSMGFHDDSVLVPVSREGGITFGFHRMIRGLKVHKSAFIPKKALEDGLGIVLKGDAPVLLCEVEPNGPSWDAGLRVDDCLTSVNGVACGNASHQTVISLVSKALQHQQEPVSTSGYNHNPSFGSAMVVKAQDTKPDATISDLDIRLPGSMDANDKRNVQKPTAAGGDDAFAPIREALSLQQLEAARLMKAGQFKAARELLDKAIELHLRLPQIVKEGSDGGGGTKRLKPQRQRPTRRQLPQPVKTSGRSHSTRRRRKFQLSFVPTELGASRTELLRRVRTQSSKLNVTHRGQQRAKSSPTTLIASVDQIPTILFAPIKKASLSQRKDGKSRRMSRHSGKTDRQGVSKTLGATVATSIDTYRDKSKVASESLRDDSARRSSKKTENRHIGSRSSKGTGISVNKLDLAWTQEAVPFHNQKQNEIDKDTKKRHDEFSGFKDSPVAKKKPRGHRKTKVASVPKTGTGFEGGFEIDTRLYGFAPT